MASAQKRGQSPPHIFRGLNDRGRHVIAGIVIVVLLVAFALLLPTKYGFGAQLVQHAPLVKAKGVRLER